MDFPPRCFRTLSSALVFEPDCSLSSPAPHPARKWFRVTFCHFKIVHSLCIGFLQNLLAPCSWCSSWSQLLTWCSSGLAGCSSPAQSCSSELKKHKITLILREFGPRLVVSEDEGEGEFEKVKVPFGTDRLRGRRLIGIKILLLHFFCKLEDL